ASLCDRERIPVLTHVSALGHRIERHVRHRIGTLRIKPPLDVRVGSLGFRLRLDCGNVIGITNRSAARNRLVGDLRRHVVETGLRNTQERVRRDKTPHPRLPSELALDIANRVQRRPAVDEHHIRRRADERDGFAPSLPLRLRGSEDVALRGAGGRVPLPVDSIYLVQNVPPLECLGRLFGYLVWHLNSSRPKAITTEEYSRDG